MTGKSNLPRWDGTADKLNSPLLLKMARLPQKVAIGLGTQIPFGLAKFLSALPVAKIVMILAKVAILIILHHINAILQIRFRSQTFSCVDGVSGSS
jgi:hypothetical protein